MASHRIDPIQQELNSVLIRVVEHFAFDFEKSAKSFVHYVRFLSSLYPDRTVLSYLDWANEFNAEICRARYSLLVFERDYLVYDKQYPSQSVATRPTAATPAPAAVTVPNQATTAVAAKEEASQPGFNIFERSLKNEFDYIYADVRSYLPEICTYADDEDDGTTVFKSNLPPPSEFELKYFGYYEDGDSSSSFAKAYQQAQLAVPSNTPSNDSSKSKPKRIFNFDANTETKPEDVLDQVYSLEVAYKNEEDLWEREFMAALEQETGLGNEYDDGDDIDEDDDDERESPIFSTVAQKESQSTKEGASARSNPASAAVVDRFADNRRRRMLPYEHESSDDEDDGVYDSEEESSD